MKKIIIFLLFIIVNVTAKSEEKPAIVLKKNSKGMLTFKVSLKTAGQIKVDWGNNNIQTYDVDAVTRFDIATAMTEKAPKNTEIKIYGKDIILFSCIDQFVTSLDLSNAPDLALLNCSKNYLKKLDLSHNKLLRSIYCNDNRFRELDFTNNLKITNITCSYNYLKQINVVKNTQLQTLNVADNLIKNLNLKGNKSLKNLSLSGNKLSSVSVNHITGLRHLDISYNKFSACELNNLFTDLPVRAKEEETQKKNLIINFNSGAKRSNAAIAKEKNWLLDREGKGKAKCN